MIGFKVDILSELKEHGYSTYYLRNQTTLSSQVIQGMRSGKVPGVKSIDILCGLLDCQPGDILEYRKDE